MNYFLHFNSLYPLKTKFNVALIFPIFKTYVENQFGIIIKSLQIDSGTKYRPIYPLFQKYGIDLHFLCPYTSQLNGKAERSYKTIVELSLSFSLFMPQCLNVIG